jgi:peptidoglycan L-alanyl-D-glutamate endopeptidase CwlK
MPDNTERRIAELHPNGRDLATQLIITARSAGIPLVITTAYRPQSVQDGLYALGRTRPGKIVTWTRSSLHTARLAFDVDLYGYAPEQVPQWVWRDLGRVWKQAGLKWGGDYQDFRHFELVSA